MQQEILLGIKNWQNKGSLSNPVDRAKIKKEARSVSTSCFFFFHFTI